MGSGFTSGCPSEPVCWQVSTSMAFAGVTPPLPLPLWQLRPQTPPHVQVCLLYIFCVLTSQGQSEQDWLPPPAHVGRDLCEGRMSTPQHGYLSSAAVQGRGKPWELNKTPQFLFYSLLAQLWLPGKQEGFQAVSMELSGFQRGCWQPGEQSSHTTAFLRHSTQNKGVLLSPCELLRGFPSPLRAWL